MTSWSRVKGGVVAVVVAAAVALPAVALAASRPKRGLWVGTQLTFKVPRTGNLSLTKVRGLNYCRKYNWRIKKIGMRHGKFSYSRSLPSGVHATVKGSFVTPKKAKGTIKIGSCAMRSFRAHHIQGY